MPSCISACSSLRNILASRRNGSTRKAVTRPAPQRDPRQDRQSDLYDRGKISRRQKSSDNFGKSDHEAQEDEPDKKTSPAPTYCAAEFFFGFNPPAGEVLMDGIGNGRFD